MAVNETKKRAEPIWDPGVYEKSWRAVWAHSAKRAARDGKTLPLQENRAKAVIAGEQAARTPQFATLKNGAHSLDEASLARARRLACGPCSRSPSASPATSTPPPNPPPQRPRKFSTPSPHAALSDTPRWHESGQSRAETPLPPQMGRRPADRPMAGSRAGRPRGI